MNPLVSIAIVTYNQKEYLKECIDSILMQDYENKEIIIADDCSTDGSSFFIKKNLINKIDKLIIHKKNFCL